MPVIADIYMCPPAGHWLESASPPGSSFAAAQCRDNPLLSFGGAPSGSGKTACKPEHCEQASGFACIYKVIPPKNALWSVLGLEHHISPDQANGGEIWSQIALQRLVKQTAEVPGMVPQTSLLVCVCSYPN